MKLVSCCVPPMLTFFLVLLFIQAWLEVRGW